MHERAETWGEANSEGRWRCFDYDELLKRDVSNVSHFGTGDLEITLSKPEDLERAMPLLKRSYEDS